jgi:hypothetical protein
VRDVSLPESGSPEVDGDQSAPALEVVAGEPSAEELAALIAVLSAVVQPAPVTGEQQQARVDSWAAPWRGIGAPAPLGPGAWSAGSIG